jgi:hypothetical protein
MKTRLIISIEQDFDTEELSVQNAHLIVESLKGIKIPEEDTKISLIRDGDRSALNILLPKIDGRFGCHYQGRKATFKELKDLFVDSVKEL